MSAKTAIRIKTIRQRLRAVTMVPVVIAAMMTKPEFFETDE